MMEGYSIYTPPEISNYIEMATGGRRNFPTQAEMEIVDILLGRSEKIVKSPYDLADIAEGQDYDPDIVDRICRW